MATETCPLEIPSELVRSDTEDSEVVSLGVDILLPQITRLETEKSKSKIVIDHIPEDDITITPILTPDSVNQDISPMESIVDSIAPIELELNINDQVQQQISISSVNQRSPAELVTLTVDPQQQQNIIEKLLLEAESLKKELKKLEVENKALSDENSIQQSRGIEAINALRERDKNRWDATTYLQTLLKQEQILSEPLHYCDRLTLLRVAVEAASRLRATDVSLQHYKTKYKDLKARQEQIMEQQKSYQELQEAHLLQSKFIQKLQKRQSKMDAFKTTIEMQERVISKMQTVIEQRLQTNRTLKAESPSPSPSALPFTTKLPPAGKVPTRSHDFDPSSSLPPPLTSITTTPVRLPESHQLEIDKQMINTTSSSSSSSAQQPLSAKEVMADSASVASSQIVKCGELSSSLQEVDGSDTAPEILTLTTERDALSEQLNLSKEKVQELESTLESSQREILRLTSEVEERSVAIKDTQKKLEAALKKNDELLASVTSKTIRIVAIEEQLVASAQHSATEISKLRTKLFEIEMGTDNINNDEGEEDGGDEDYIAGQTGDESEVTYSDSKWNFDVSDKELEFKDEETVTNPKSPRLARSLSVTDSLEKKQSNVNLLASSSATLLPERQSFRSLSPRLESLVAPLTARNIS